MTRHKTNETTREGRMVELAWKDVPETRSVHPVAHAFMGIAFADVRPGARMRTLGRLLQQGPEEQLRTIARHLIERDRREELASLMSMRALHATGNFLRGTLGVEQRDPQSCPFYFPTVDEFSCMVEDGYRQGLSGVVAAWLGAPVCIEDFRWHDVAAGGGRAVVRIGSLLIENRLTRLNGGMGVVQSDYHFTFGNGPMPLETSGVYVARDARTLGSSAVSPCIIS